MIEVVEKEIELAPGGKALCLGDETVVCGVKLTREPSKHGRDGQVKLVVTVK